MIIFDCNGVLVDSEPIATAVAAQEFSRVGFPLTPELVARYFTGKRVVDMIAQVEAATKRKVPPEFTAELAAATMRALRAELRPIANVAEALPWLRERKCVASASTLDRVRLSLDIAGLTRLFEPYLYSAAEVAHGKPAPDLYLHAAQRMNVPPAECIVIEDAPVGISAAVAAGMVAVGFVGGSHAEPELDMALRASGAQAVITDMRQLKKIVTDIRMAQHRRAGVQKTS